MSGANFTNLLTESECIDIVTKSLGSSEFMLKTYSIKPLSDEILGYTGSHLRLKCNIQNDSETKDLSFFIKTKELKGGELEFEIVIFENEATILEFLSNNSKASAHWFPKLIMSKKPCVMVLEDLTERNYELGKIQLADFDVAHCKVVLESLAELHGFSLGYEYRKKLIDPDYSILDEMNIFGDMLNTKETESGQLWLKSGLDATLYLINESAFETIYNKSLIVEELLAFEDKYCKGLLPIKSPYSVISHGDLWGNNLMFNYKNDSPKKCCIIDFQILRYLPFTFDVHFFIYVNTTQEFRRQHMSKLLDFYYYKLRDVLSKNKLSPDLLITKDIYESLCVERRNYAIYLSIFYKTFLLMDRSYFNKVMTDPEYGFTRFVFGDRRPHLKLQLEEDTNFKKKLFLELQDLLHIFMSTPK